MSVNTNYNKFTSLLSDKGEIKNLLGSLKAFPGNIIGTDSAMGKTYITDYFELKNTLNEFKKIKDCLLTIIELSKIDFQKIKFSKKKYNLYKEKIFFSNFTGNSDNDLRKNLNSKIDLFLFIELFINNEFMLYKDTDTLDFLNIFQNEYFEKSKNYFINIMNKYITIRKNICKKIQNMIATGNTPHLCYKDLYEYHEDYNLEIKKNITKDKSANYVLYGNNVSFNNNTSKSLNTLTEQNKLFKNRDDYEKLYKNKKSKDIYINDFIKRYKYFHNDFYKGLNNILSGPSNLDLYTYLINSINTDYNLINFILYFNDNKSFEDIITNYLVISNDILLLINNFEKYYDPYLSWHKSIIDPSVSTPYKTGSIENFGDFTDYYDEEIKNLFPSTPPPPPLKY
jgi:hypothetical protein